MKPGKLFFLTFLIISMVLLIHDVKGQYTLTTNVETIYPAKLPTLITATISPPEVGKKITIKPSWWDFPDTQYTGSDGSYTWNITMPVSGSYNIIFSSPSGLFPTVTEYFEVKPGIKPKLTYDTIQYFDPESIIDDIYIYAEAINTETDTPVNMPEWTPTILSSPVTVNWYIEPLGGAKYLIKGGLSYDTGGTFKFRIEATFPEQNLYPVPTEGTIFIGSQPIQRVKFLFGDGTEVWVGESTQTPEIELNTNSIDIYIENTKGKPLDAVIVRFEIITDITETLEPQKIEIGHYRLYYTFSAAIYNIIITTRYGVYQEFTASQKVSTIKIGFDIWKFITTPWILGAIAIFFVIAGLKFLSRRKKYEEW
jgi:hypothetical protein